MSLKDFSGYDSTTESSKLRGHKQNDIESLLGFFIGVGVVCVILFVPSVNAPLRQMLSHPTRPKLDSSVRVWISKDSGTYYCLGSTLYGLGSGSYVTQGDALTSGYQPALNEYCTEDKPKDAKTPDLSSAGDPLPSAPPL
jgi:hypothetical protein